MSQLTILRNFTSLHRKRLMGVMHQQQLRLTHSSSSFNRRQQEAPAKESLTLHSNNGRTDISTDVRPLGEKIKENTKTASYTAIILAGITVTGVMFYAIFRELFSSFSPNNIYSDALDRVKDDPRVQDSIGAPIKGFGEENRRGRRQHVAHQTYERNGVQHMRMQFYVQGIRNRATVHLESRTSTSGKIEYRYLFVQLDHYPRTTIILEDNRALDALVHNPPQSSLPSLEFTSFEGGK